MALSDALEADALRQSSSPAYPSNGRTVNGGYVLVDGVPLCLVRRSRCLGAARSSQVAAIFAKWRDRVGNIHFSVLEKGEESVRREIRRLMASGKSVIVSDALTDEDLLLLVRSVRSTWPQSNLGRVRGACLGAGSDGFRFHFGFFLKICRRLVSLPARLPAGLQPSCGSQPSGGPQSVGGPQPLRRRTLVLFGSLNPVSAAQWSTQNGRPPAG